VTLSGPGFLPILLLPVALAILGAAARRGRRRSLERFVHAARWDEGIPGRSPVAERRRLALATTCLGLAALALLGPTVGYAEREVRRRGIDLVLAVDTSRSMLAGDVRPSRLERAKREIRGLLRRLRGDRVALVGFAGDARVACPLTHDYASFEGFLEELDPSRNRVGGTDLGAAIRESLRLFDGRSGSHEAVVLLTDGEDLTGEGLAAANAALEKRIRIFVLGVGTAEGGKILLAEGGGERFLEDRSGEEVVSRLESGGLAAIAERSGGEFLPVTASAAPLEDLYDARIAAVEEREFEGAVRREPIDRFQWPLAAAIGIALLVAALDGGRRRR